VWTSSQNIDRIVTVFKACKKVDRQLVMDLYTAEVLRSTGNDAVPQGTWRGVRVYLPEYQRRDVKRKGLYEMVNRYRSNRLYPENLAEETTSSVLFFRPKMGEDLEKANCLQGAGLIYSLWEGYMKMEAQKPFREWLKQNRIPLTQIHTSGHASPHDLSRFAKALNPKILVPIHTFSPENFENVFSQVKKRKDGEWWEVE
jgi:ribonuclease J